MVKIRVDWDERYPDYMITSGTGVEIEVTDEELALIKQAGELYERAQNILARARSLRTSQTSA
jgi:hypothetical protein